MILIAVIEEVSDIETVSYADDVSLITRAEEAALQLGVNLTQEFCSLTGMALNLKKTTAFGTQKGYSADVKVGEVYVENSE